MRSQGARYIVLFGAALILSACAVNRGCPPPLLLEGARSFSQYASSEREAEGLLYEAEIETIEVSNCYSLPSGASRANIEISARIRPATPGAKPSSKDPAPPDLFLVPMDESGFLAIPTIIPLREKTPARIRAAAISKRRTISIPYGLRAATHILAGFVISEEIWRSDRNAQRRALQSRQEEQILRAKSMENWARSQEGLTPCRGNLFCLFGDVSERDGP